MISVLHTFNASLETNHVFFLFNGELPFTEVESWDTCRVSLFILATLSESEGPFSIAVTSFNQHALVQFFSLLTHVHLFP